MSYVGQISAGGATNQPVASTLYGTCDTAAGTAAKVVTCADFDQLMTGVTIHVKFTNTNTIANPTLNVNNTGAKNIYKYGTTAPGTSAATSWQAGSVISFTYDGTSWQMDNHLDDTNTWRGIQDNLTSSTNTTESLSAKQGYLLANGSARDNTKLPLSGGTMTGHLTTSAGTIANGSKQASSTTIPNLVDEIRVSNGAMGSVSLSTAYTSNNITIPTGWYNYLYIPHRTGGINGSSTGAADNVDWGKLILSHMTTPSNGTFIISVTSNGTNHIGRVTEVIEMSSTGGVSFGRGEDLPISANNTGSLAFGKATNNGEITSDALGSLTFGYANGLSSDTDPVIKAAKDGSCAFGHVCDNGSISANGKGSLAFGLAETNDDNSGNSSIEAAGEGSLAFGYMSEDGDTYEIKASGRGSFAGGYSNTFASGDYSMAFGYGCVASGGGSLALGLNNQSSGFTSFASGSNTNASATSAAAIGASNTSSNYAATALGKYNAAMTTGGAANNTTGHAFVIGKGTGATAKSNCFSVMYSGVVKAASTITASTTADYAEYFEWEDQNPTFEDRVGYFVTLDGNKIRKATNEDDYILGVVSGEPFVLGNADCDVWNGMYLRDDFRRVRYERAPMMEVDEHGMETDVQATDEDGNLLWFGMRPVLNPEYNPDEPYVSRSDRPEWSPIGMLGVLAVRQDGTLEVNGYATVNEEGLATACDKYHENAYRVIKVINYNVAEIIFK